MSVCARVWKLIYARLSIIRRHRTNWYERSNKRTNEPTNERTDGWVQQYSLNVPFQSINEWCTIHWAKCIHVTSIFKIYSEWRDTPNAIHHLSIVYCVRECFNTKSFLNSLKCIKSLKCRPRFFFKKKKLKKYIHNSWTSYSPNNCNLLTVLLFVESERHLWMCYLSRLSSIDSG